MKMSNRINQIITDISYVYIGIPFILFLLGWCRWYIACIGIVAIVYAMYKACNNELKVSGVIWTKKNIGQIISVLLILSVWVYLSGIGAYAFQNTDHIVRNSIFEVLVHDPWPVIKDYSVNGQVSTRGLIYYIGFWLPAAAAGKLFGIQFGYFALYLWTLLGVIIVFLWICQIRGTVSVWPVFVLIFFSGLDILGYYIVRGGFGNLTNQTHIEWWIGSGTYQFSSNTTQLFWVFNQAIPAWVIVILLYVQKNNRQIIFLLSLAMLSSTFPFVGMIPFVIYFMVTNTKQATIKEWFSDLLRNTFTIENIVAGGIVGFITFFYLMSNNVVGGTVNTSSISSEQSIIMENEQNKQDLDKNVIQEKELLDYNITDMDMLNEQARRGVSIFKGVLFLLIECGIYIIIILHYNDKKEMGVIYVALVSFIVCLMIKVGEGGDFCMRASIPGLFLLCVEVIRTIDECRNNKRYVGMAALIILVMLGSVTPMQEINRTIQTSLMRMDDQTAIIDTFLPEEALLQGDNFSGKTDNSLFYKYLSAK